MGVVNYREQRIAPLLFFLLFVLVCLLGMPLWALRHFGTSQSPFAGKLIIAPILGGLYLITVVRTFRFNARVRRDPRAIQWDSRGLSLWQGGRAQTAPWRQVRQVAVNPGRKTSDLSFLKIVTCTPEGGVMRWGFPAGRLQLSGQSLPAIASQIEQARSGSSAVSAPAPIDTEAAADREDRVAAARGLVAIIACVYFVMLVGMIIYLSSSKAMLLTPHDPLLWLAAKIGFFATFGGLLLWFIKVSWNLPLSSPAARNVFGTLFFTALFSGALMGLWAYLAANVYVTARTFGGHVEHGAVLMVAEPWVSHHGRPAVHAHLINRSGRDVFFTIDEADKKSMDAWYRPGVPENRACVTVPVEWAGYAIRAEVTEDDPLPRGSVTGCS